MGEEEEDGRRGGRRRTQREEVEPRVIVRIADVAAFDDGENEEGEHQPP